MILAKDHSFIHHTAASDEPVRRTRRRQRGALAVTEMVVYLIVFIVFSALAAWAAAYLYGQGDASLETSNAQSLLASARQLREPGGYGNGSLLPSLDVQGGLPTTMSYNSSNDTLKNTWNGSVTLVGRGAGYRLIYENVPKDACISMAQKVNLDKRIGLMINSRTGRNNGTHGAMARSEATSKCNKDYNTLKWETNVSG